MSACQAIVEDRDNVVTRCNIRRPILVYGTKGCTRRATVRLGELCLCPTHAGLARAGLLAADGRVEDASVRRYPDKFPGGIHAWARDLVETSVD